MIGLGLTLMGGLVVPAAAYDETEVYYPAHSVAAPITTGAARNFFHRTFSAVNYPAELINEAAQWRLYYRAENITKTPTRYSYFAGAGFLISPSVQKVTPYIAFQMQARMGGTVDGFSSVLNSTGERFYASGEANLEIDFIQVTLADNMAVVQDSIGKGRAGKFDSDGTIGSIWTRDERETITIAGFTTANCRQDFCGSATQHLSVENWRTFVIPMKAFSGQTALYEANMQMIEGL